MKNKNMKRTEFSLLKRKSALESLAGLERICDSFRKRRGQPVNTELVIFIIYLAFMLGIGVYFFLKSRGSDEKEYFLGGRHMGPWVSALSANDSITVPQYLTNRFLSSSKFLQVICAIIFLVAYTIYAASSVKACGTLFHTVIGIDSTLAMYIAAVIIVSYTFLGGFSAVCWTDFFQGLLMLGALLIAPIFALGLIQAGEAAMTVDQLPEDTGICFRTGRPWLPAWVGEWGISACRILSSDLCQYGATRI